MDVAKRLNLTIPAHFDAQLHELSELTGRSKASFVLDAVAGIAGFWAQELERLRGFAACQAASSSRDGDGVILPPASQGALSRQQRRRLERMTRKKGG